MQNQKPIQLGNIVQAKPSNLQELLRIRQHVTSFEEQSRFVSDNWASLKPYIQEAQ